MVKMSKIKMLPPALGTYICPETISTWQQKESFFNQRIGKILLQVYQNSKIQLTSLVYTNTVCQSEF